MTNSDFARNIAKGEKRRRDTNYDEIEARILAKLKKLPSYDLDWVENMVNHLIARTQQPPKSLSNKRFEKKYNNMNTCQ